ncbi:hypothetical protein CDCA_CDCA01G0399 [Cyanidium caldarium]|uniref:Methionine aminopeptidase n=1 Tax=Cyanidium caldarium TaxID=2771 RepID=A0AAV9IPY9_CYACA|nr:hypothetical protein CDCA_CDCA01G0399 [Cyanidium caldarium]
MATHARKLPHTELIAAEDTSDTPAYGRRCAKPGCVAAAAWQCAVCARLGMRGAPGWFCSPECFQGWRSFHEKLHQAARLKNAQQAIANVKALDTGVGACAPPAGFCGYTGYTGSLRPWEVTPYRPVRREIARPDYAYTQRSLAEEEAQRSGSVPRLRPEQVERLRAACEVARAVLDAAGAAVDVGVTTDDLDAIVHEECMRRDAYPSPLNYYGFPKSCCTSVNEVICHGIPDRRPLQDGDIVDIDVTVYYNGYHGDLNETYLVGRVDRASKRLVKNAYDCLQAGIASVRPGRALCDIGAVIERQARRHGHSVVRGYCGHGIHELFHGPPNIPHYAKNRAVGVAQPGMAFTIEPMICAGSARDVLWPDRWTAVTADGKRSAQFEETLLVTPVGVEVLTAKNDASPRYFWQRDGWEEE